MTTKHTPGDWFLEMSDFTIRSKEIVGSNQMADYRGSIICDMKPGLGVEYEDLPHLDRVRTHARAETDANARLIAAAPDLLEALKNIMNGLSLDPNRDIDETWENAIKKARAAIAKAEGRDA